MKIKIIDNRMKKKDAVINQTITDLTEQVNELRSELLHQRQKHQDMFWFICKCIHEGNFKKTKDGGVRFGSAIKKKKQ